LEEFASRFLVSGMYGLNPAEDHVNAVLRSIFYAYLSYVAFIFTGAAILIWVIRKIGSRYTRVAVLTLFFIGLLFSPFVFFGLENSFRPPKVLLEVYVHISPVPIWIVVGLAMSLSIIWLRIRPMPN
jgi:4-amino-4-deoxy-L-arabinose transferase-like glycosyltransferase